MFGTAGWSQTPRKREENVTGSAVSKGKATQDVRPERPPPQKTSQKITPLTDRGFTGCENQNHQKTTHDENTANTVSKAEGLRSRPDLSCFPSSATKTGLAKPRGPIKNKEQGGLRRRGKIKEGMSSRTHARYTRKQLAKKGEDEGNSRLRAFNERSPGAEAQARAAQLADLKTWLWNKDWHAGNVNTHGKHPDLLLKQWKIKSTQQCISPRSAKRTKQRRSCLSLWISNGALGSLSAGNLLVELQRD